jgi:hypothetical protein
MIADFFAATTATNLRRWRDSGLPRQWLEDRQGRWDHAAWEQLLADLRQSEFWPLDAAAVGRTLEEMRHEHDNLQRWLASGQPRRWVEMHDGRWGHDEWCSLLEYLRYSAFWPVAPAAVGQLIERLAQERANLRRWQETGAARHWVEERQGSWDHHDWLALVELLRPSGFWPLELAEVARTLEELKRGYENVRRWQDSGAARLWAERFAGRGDHAARLTLLDALQKSEFWPMEPLALEKALQEIEAEARNLRRWEESGTARQWLDAQQGQWSQADWQTLLEDLRASAFWPLAPAALGRRLGQLKLEWWNLERWRVSGLARRWIEAHQGDWSAADWQALLVDLEKCGFWPLDTMALGRMLAEMRADWWQLRPWLQPGQPLRASEDNRGRDDLRGLLEALRREDFWPADTGRPETEKRQAA